MIPDTEIAALTLPNITLVGLRPIGGTMVVPAFGRHEGRRVELQCVTDGTRRFVRATVNGVAIHVPDGVLSDDQIVRLACEQVPVDGAFAAAEGR